MIDQNIQASSPLSASEIEMIEDTKLSVLERHHLRVLAHCLACFKDMANGLNEGSLPNKENRLKWCLAQPSLATDQSFIPVLLDQFTGAARQLETVANELGISPLELTLRDLIQKVTLKN